MIVWSGRGFLSVLVLIVALFASMGILPKEHSDYAFIIATFVAAAFSWYFGNKWNNKNTRVVIDEQTGQRIVLKNNHSLFWINMEYWGLIFSILSIVILAQNSMVAAIIAGVALMVVVGYVFTVSKNSKEQPQVGKMTVVKERKVVSNKDVIQLNPDKNTNREAKENPNRFMPK